MEPHQTTDVVLKEIIALYRAARTQHPTELELEIRLGSSSETSFCPGVPQGVFEQLQEDMSEDGRLVARDPWKEMIDYHYVGLDGQPIRTRVIGDSECMEIRKEHTRKVVLGKALVQGERGSADAARVILSHEVPVVDPPASCVPTHIRIKQRRTFDDRRDGVVVWSYELSKTWSANSRSAVEYRQHMNEPIYEVECELVDQDGAYLRQLSDAQICESILVKLRALLGKDMHAKLEVEKEEVVPSQGAGAHGRARARKRHRSATRAASESIPARRDKQKR
jgi:hypothetical protein